jgi:hypothetical protein
MFVRTWNSLGLWRTTPSAFGPGAWRTKTPGGIVIFFGSGPAVC